MRILTKESTNTLIGITLASLLSLAPKTLNAQAKRTIEIPLAMSAAKATDLLQLVALRREVGILSNEGGVMVFEPIHPRPKNPTIVNLRANIVRTSDSTTIVAISGRWYSPTTAAFPRALVGKDLGMQKDVGEPVDPATKGWRAELWAVVKNFGEAVEASGNSKQ
jgi:hypothetical protein